MSRRRVPKGRVLRKAWLDHAALTFALAAVRDDRLKVAEKGDVAGDWELRYEAAERHLQELLRRAEEA